jgi:LAS superfamily LD-carboxypeptidase LdcB
MGGNVNGYIYTSWGRVRDVYYALEGYISGDTHRLPNTSYPGVSKHVYGWAVDVGSLDDILRDDEWTQQQDSEIDRIAHKYGLYRPYNNHSYVWYTQENVIAEWWHFEREFGFR